MKFSYDDESKEFVNEITSQFLKIGNFEAIERIGRYQDALEKQCLELSSNPKKLQGYLFTTPAQEILHDAVRREKSSSIGKFIPDKTFSQPIPLNAFAAIMVLYDYLIAPQRCFRVAEGIFESVLKSKLEILDETDAVLYDSGVAAKAETAENADQEEKNGFGFWKLLDTFLEKYPRIKSRKSSKDLLDPESLTSKEKITEIVVELAGIVAVYDYLLRIESERKGRGE
jgi:hypothetical protein